MTLLYNFACEMRISCILVWKGTSAEYETSLKDGKGQAFTCSVTCEVKLSSNSTQEDVMMVQ